MDYYYLDGQETRGPFDRPGLTQLIHTGIIKPDTYIYHKDLGEWKRYRDAYYDLFPESRPAFMIGAAGTTKPPIAPGVNVNHPAAAAPGQVKDTLTESESDHDPASGVMAEIIAFYSMYSLWIKVAAVVLVLGLVGGYVAKNREKWVEDAITMDRGESFDADDARKEIKAAAKEWKKTAKYVEKGQIEKAIESYDKGFKEVMTLHHHNNREVIDGNKKVADLIKEAVDPVIVALDKKHFALLDQLEQGDISKSQVDAYVDQFRMVVYDNFSNNFRERRHAIDKSRAERAGKVFRLMLHLEYPDKFSDETKNYRRIRETIEQMVRAQFAAPPGYIVEVASPSGPLEEEATFFTCSVRVRFDYLPYYFDKGDDPEFSKLFFDREPRRYSPDAVIVNKIIVTLFDYNDRARMEQRGIKTNWDNLSVYVATVPPPPYIKVSKDAKPAERIMVMARHDDQVADKLIEKLQTGFKLPKLTVSKKSQ
ncbi:MAG: DUF4339 domain-containing protein [Verrucomicrobiota bacterium]